MPPPKPVGGLRKLFGLPAKKPFPGPVYERVDVVYKVISNYPPSYSTELEQLRLELEKEEFEEIIDLSEKLYGRGPAHHFFGFPEPVQNNDMELEIEARRQGVQLRYENNSLAPGLEYLAPTAAEWRLLLQVDSDDEAGFMWGDAGRIYFWMRARDAANLAFDQAEAVGQCG
jgi:uncharacterized protein YwqG